MTARSTTRSNLAFWSMSKEFRRQWIVLFSHNIGMFVHRYGCSSLAREHIILCPLISRSTPGQPQWSRSYMSVFKKKKQSNLKNGFTEYHIWVLLWDALVELASARSVREPVGAVRAPPSQLQGIASKNGMVLHKVMQTKSCPLLVHMLRQAPT